MSEVATVRGAGRDGRCLRSSARSSWCACAATTNGRDLGAGHLYLLAGAPTSHQNTLRVVPRRYRRVHEFVRTSGARVMGG
jgi:hypothetical protein